MKWLVILCENVDRYKRFDMCLYQSDTEILHSGRGLFYELGLIQSDTEIRRQKYEIVRNNIMRTKVYVNKKTLFHSKQS